MFSCSPLLDRAHRFCTTAGVADRETDAQTPGTALEKKHLGGGGSCDNGVSGSTFRHGDTLAQAHEVKTTQVPLSGLLMTPKRGTRLLQNPKFHYKCHIIIAAKCQARDGD